MNDIYTYTVPLFTKLLGGLKTVLVKAEADAQAGKFSEEALLKDALAPDMFPFVKQVQIATDNAKGVVARLTDVETPVFEDNETSLTQLIERVEKCIAFLETVPEASFEGAHTKRVEIKYFPGKYMEGAEYVKEFVLPNFFFHLTMAYALARKNDVALGKADYLNGLPLRDL
jgi:hypothetical protein